MRHLPPKFSSSRLACLLAAAVLVAAGVPESRTDPLFQALKYASDAQQAAAAEARIVGYWHSEATPSVQLLAEHAQKALTEHDYAGALKDMDAALDLQPELADLWRLHAEARFANGDDAGAYADIAQALSREPRCFTALADLSHFAEARDDQKRALEAWQKFLTIDPKAENGEKRLDELTRKVDGEQL